MLRGTNTVERIAASAEILRCFAGTKTLCFAATHDLELTGLLQDVYDNYHFGEEIVDGDVRFSYRLMKGPSTSCNAIALLGTLGYDRAIVDKARERADRFLQTEPRAAIRTVPAATARSSACRMRRDRLLKKNSPAAIPTPPTTAWN